MEVEVEVEEVVAALSVKLTGFRCHNAAAGLRARVLSSQFERIHAERSRLVLRNVTSTAPIVSRAGIARQIVLA